MSISKIKAMTEMLAKMEEMEKSVTEDVNKDITKKRKAALNEIIKYLNEVAESLDGRSLIIDLSNTKIFGSCERGDCILFNNTYKINNSCTNTRWSEEKLPWHIKCDGGYKRGDYTCLFIDAEDEPIIDKQWKAGYLNLIEKWPSIKAEIEAGVERELTKMMEATRKRTEDKINSYKIADDFEV